MTCEEALALAAMGKKMTCKAFAGDFLLVREGRTLRGSYMGESSFATVHAYALTDADKRQDWQEFCRILPDPWEGCDSPLLPTNHSASKESK